MYAETGLLFPCLQGYPQELHHQHHPLEEELLCRLQASNSHRHLLLHDSATSNLVQTTTISDYDLGGEGDLFNAPAPIIEEPVMELDYMSAVMSMMCNGDNVVCKEASKVVAVDPLQNEQLLIEDFYERKNDPQAKNAIEAAYSDLVDVELPTLQIEGENTIYNDNFAVDEDNQRSISSGSLESLDHFREGFMSPEFFDVSGMNIGGVLGIRRAYSDGDMQAVVNGHLGHFNGSIVHLPFERLVTIGEDRRQKLSRYRKKKTKRNFGRKIKYACRKALADSQPRVRGRFAKTEECGLAKPSK